MNVENLKTIDPFAEEQEPGTSDKDAGGQQDKKIHIRIQQRTGRKSITTVHPVPHVPGIETRDLLTRLKKKFACNGHHAQVDDAFQLTGDQRTNVQAYLLSLKDSKDKKKKLFTQGDIQIHGF